MFVQNVQYKSCRSCMESQHSHIFALLDDKTELIYLIDKLLTDLLAQTKNIRPTGSKFECKEVPGITVLQYLRRICKYAHCSESVFVAALIYIDRYQERLQNFIINYYNIHRLLITCLMIAAKYLDDFYYKNDFYAKIGGIPPKDINILELQIMYTFDFSLFISQEEFLTYLTRLDNYQQINS